MRDALRRFDDAGMMVDGAAYDLQPIARGEQPVVTQRPNPEIVERGGIEKTLNDGAADLARLQQEAKESALSIQQW